MAYSIESESGFGELLRFRRSPLRYVAEAGPGALIYAACALAGVGSFR
jgi:hypothetical protein